MFLTEVASICFPIFYFQLDPENVEALVALAILDLQTNEGQLIKIFQLFSLPIVISCMNKPF